MKNKITKLALLGLVAAAACVPQNMDAMKKNNNTQISKVFSLELRKKFDKALRSNDKKEIQKYINLDVGINMSSCDIENPLIYAIYKIKNFEIVKLLIENGANVNSKESSVDNSFGKNTAPLHYAACIGDINIVKFLVSNLADIHIKNTNGMTPLYMAARYGHYEVLKFLIENGANVNSKDVIGQTPLFAAAYMSNSKEVKFLINNGSHIGIQDKRGQTALGFALKAKKPQQEIIIYLQNVTNEFANFIKKPSKPTVYAPTSAYLKMFCESRDFKMLCEDKSYKNSLNFYILSNFYILFDKIHHNNLEIATKTLENNNKNNIIKSGFYLTSKEFNMKKRMLNFNQHVDCNILYQDKKFSL